MRLWLEVTEIHLLLHTIILQDWQYRSTITTIGPRLKLETLEAWLDSPKFLKDWLLLVAVGLKRWIHIVRWFDGFYRDDNYGDDDDNVIKYEDDRIREV